MLQIAVCEDEQADRENLIGILKLLLDNYFWTAINGSIDLEVINTILSADISFLDGVTMEVGKICMSEGEVFA